MNRVRIGGSMQLTDETVLVVGRLTLAATELEYLLAWIGADQAGGDPAAVFAVPGQPLRAVRGSVQFASRDRRDEFIGLVDVAGTYRTHSHTALRSMWLEKSPVNAATGGCAGGFLEGGAVVEVAAGERVAGA